MIATGFFYILSAAYLAGISSTIWVFGMFVRATKGSHASSGCVIRGAAAALLVISIYLAIAGWQLLVSAGTLLY